MAVPFELLFMLFVARVCDGFDEVGKVSHTTNVFRRTGGTGLLEGRNVNWKTNPHEQPRECLRHMLDIGRLQTRVVANVLNELDDVFYRETVDNTKIDHEASPIVLDIGTGYQVKSGNLAATYVLPLTLPCETFVERLELFQGVDRATSNHRRLAILEIAALCHDDNGPDINRDLRRRVILHIKQGFEYRDLDVDKHIPLVQPFRRCNPIKYKVNPGPGGPRRNEIIHHLVLRVALHRLHPTHFSKPHFQYWSVRSGS